MPERERVYAIKDARFVASAPNLSALKTLPAGGPEVAFIGRSNVGKSSLINALVERRRLVRTSKTPGQTRALQFFDVVVQGPDGERALRIVDLPGYGFARVSQAERLRMSALLASYLEERAGLVAVVQLIDARHTPTVEDRRLMQQILSIDHGFIIAMTKADKLPASKRKPAKDELARALERTPEDIVLVSAEHALGRAALWSRIFAHLTPSGRA